MLVHAAAAAAVAGIVGSSSMVVSPQQDPLPVDIAYAPEAIFDVSSSQPVRSSAESPTARPPVPRMATGRTAARAPRAPALAPNVAHRPRFALSGGTVATGPAVAMARGASIDEASGGGLQRGSAPVAGSSPPGAAAAPGTFAALLERDVDVRARLLVAAPLAYPAAARREEIEVDYPLEIVVDAAGRVVAARAVSRAGYGIDEAALGAVGQYQFSPARRDGRAVAVRMRWVVQFRLR